MKTGWIWTALALAILSTGFAQQRVPISAPMQDAAGQHHQRGVEFHLKRCLDQASQEYASALEIEPPREATAAADRSGSALPAETLHDALRAIPPAGFRGHPSSEPPIGGVSLVLGGRYRLSGGQ